MTILTARMLKAILENASEEELDLEIWAEDGGDMSDKGPVTIESLELRVIRKTGRPFLWFFRGDYFATGSSKVDYYQGVKNAPTDIQATATSEHDATAAVQERPGTACACYGGRL